MSRKSQEQRKRAGPKLSSKNMNDEKLARVQHASTEELH